MRGREEIEEEERRLDAGQCVLEEAIEQAKAAGNKNRLIELLSTRREIRSAKLALNWVLREIDLGGHTLLHHFAGVDKPDAIT